MKMETGDELTRENLIKVIKDQLKKRSGKSWSVTGGKGTSYGWITIDVPPARRKFASDGQTPKEKGYSYASLAERLEIGKLLGLDGPIHIQGLKIPPSRDYYREYLDRAKGRTPEKIAQPYWD